MYMQELRSLQEAYLDVYLNESAASSKLSMRARDLADKYPPGSKKNKMYNRLSNLAGTRTHDTFSGINRPSGINRTRLSQRERDERRGEAWWDRQWGGSHTYGPGGITNDPKKLKRQIAMGQHRESYNIYDIILSHLLDEGYAETQQAAEAIMVNMSEEWRNSIIG